ncbi:glycoside hydrolase family 5 protein [Xylariaceae sp. FL0255]|nr:glycoside hydrolase family 5 protein [Xylariaceae sp. FL0255]
MASSYQDDSEPTERRRIHSDAHRKHHKRRQSREHGVGSSSRHRSSQKLSMDALAQLNDINSRGIAPAPVHSREPDRRRRSRPRREDYDVIEVEYDTPKKESRRRHEAPDYEYDNPRRARRREEDYTESERDPDTPRRARRQRVYETPEPEDDGDTRYVETERKRKKKKKKRVVSGAIVEEGRATELRGGNASKHSSYDSVKNEKQHYYKPPGGYKKKRKWIVAGVGLLVVIIIIIIAVVVSKKNSHSLRPSSGSTGSGSSDDVPEAARGTYLDPSTWYTTTDFNTTYTNETVGDLPIEGLFSTWDDSAQANDNVPALNKAWGDYSKTPARGVCLGGWLSLEPFITPSLFAYDSELGIIDEYTLSTYLGASGTAKTLEMHYATFVTEQTFQDIQNAGLDHVRIPFSYWAVQTYDSDPYLFRTSWRYLLRSIEYARKYGLRVNLDLHGLPGSQNGWNHSGRQGPIGWLNGTNGALNAQRSLDVHNRLSQFFAQDRYKNIIAFYGLANEPQMLELDFAAVTNWTESAYKLVQSNGLTTPYIVFGDGFLGLPHWQGKLTGYSQLVLDSHQYVIFNNALIKYSHSEKVKFACDDWTQQSEQSLDTSTGFGPTIFAEWSQADTDCAFNLNNVGWGNRWEGTYDSGNASSEALTPMCPLASSECSCTNANATTDKYSNEYKSFLLYFAEAQMYSFEKGWGWWYWTWDTESSPQWSYKQGLAAGILPAKAYDRSFNCDDSDIPDYSSSGGLDESY